MSIQSTFINTGVNVHITVNSNDEKLCLENMWKILFEPIWERLHLLVY